MQAITQYQVSTIERQADVLAMAQVLPELVGSEAQVTWADAIRRKALSTKLAVFMILDARMDDAERQGNAAQAQLVDQKFDAVLSNTSAKYWIDARTNNDSNDKMRVVGNWIK